MPVPLDATFTADDSQLRRMAALAAQEPYCLKDPRFAATLDAWRPLLEDAVFAILEKRLGVPLDPSVVDPRLDRARGTGSVPGDVAALYARLCALAGASRFTLSS